MATDTIIRPARHGERRKSPKVYPREGLAKVIEAARFLNCQKTTVYAMIKEGKLQTVSIRREMRIPWHMLWAYIGRPISEPARNDS